MITYYILDEHTLCFQQNDEPVTAIVSKEDHHQPPKGHIKLGNDSVLRHVVPDDSGYFKLWMEKCLREAAIPIVR